MMKYDAPRRFQERRSIELMVLSYSIMIPFDPLYWSRVKRNRCRYKSYNMKDNVYNHDALCPSSVPSLHIIITQRLLINIVISPKGLNMRSFVWLKRTKERVAKN